MFEITAKNRSTNKIFSRQTFPTLEEANLWLDDKKSKEHWLGLKGKRDIIKEDNTEEYDDSLVLSEEQVLIQEEYEQPIYDDNNEITEYNTIPAVYKTKVTLDSEYVVEGPIDITDQYNLAQQKLERREKGKLARLCCEEVLDVVAGYNIERVLTPEHIDQMQTTFANPEKALRSYRPDTAKELIAAITPDEVLLTVEMKSDIMEIFDNYNI